MRLRGLLLAGLSAAPSAGSPCRPRLEVEVGAVRTARWPTSRAGPLRAGAIVAAAMELGADQGANTLLGLTAPTWRLPLVTQLRAFVAHLVYGVSLGLLLAAGRDP